MASTCLLGALLEGLRQVLSSFLPVGLRCEGRILPVGLRCEFHILCLHRRGALQGGGAQAGHRGDAPGLQRDGMGDHGVAVHEDVPGVGQDVPDQPDDLHFHLLQTTQPTTCIGASSSPGFQLYLMQQGQITTSHHLLQSASLCRGSHDVWLRQLCISSACSPCRQQRRPPAIQGVVLGTPCGDKLLQAALQHSLPEGILKKQPRSPDPPGRPAVHDGGMQHLQTAAPGWTADVTPSSWCDL